jgi:hypothetical protein
MSDIISAAEKGIQSKVQGLGVGHHAVVAGKVCSSGKRESQS